MTGGLAAYRHLAADAERVLRDWAAPDDAQDLARWEFLEVVRADPTAVAKAGPPAHLTASCLVVSADRSHVLLTHHRKADRWFQTGGHLEAGDADLRAAATREASEESGVPGLVVTPVPVQLDRHVLVGSFGACREHLDVRYAALAPPGAEPVVGAESHDVRWWPVDALPEEDDVDLEPLVQAALRALERRPGSPA